VTGRYQVPPAGQPFVGENLLITNPWWQWAQSIGKNAGDPIEWSVIVNTPTTLAGYGITDAQPLDSDLTALAALSSTGIVVRTGAATYTLRSVAVGTGLTVTNGSGVSGDPTVALDTAATITWTGTHTFNNPLIGGNVIRLKAYTVATLPAGTQGDTAYVTDANAPTYLATIAGGGAVVCPVFYDGTNWVAH
jgi:hypothetical protein